MSKSSVDIASGHLDVHGNVKIHVIQVHYFIWQLQFVTSRRYFAKREGGCLSGFRVYDEELK
jgi:hypothetical protein